MGHHLLEKWRASVEAKRPLSETITAETLDGFDHNKLTRLARELQDRVLLDTPGYVEALADLVSISRLSTTEHGLVVLPRSSVVDVPFTGDQCLPPTTV